MKGGTGFCPWSRSEKPVPLVALLASEAPGRIAWALDQGADALIAKPVTASAVYPALVMATRRHAEARELAERIEGSKSACGCGRWCTPRCGAFMAADGCERGRGLWPAAARGHAAPADP